MSSPWFPFGSGAEGRLRVICLPFAGGGASSFLSWRRSVPAGVSVVPVQYPGHETRMSEPCLLQLPALVEQLTQAIAPLLDRPCVLLGYSMGARLAYCVAHRLAERGLPAPRALFALANRAPDLAPLRPGVELLPDAEFDAAVLEFGGMAPEILQDPELCAIVRRLLRADFTLTSGGPVPQAPLACPIHVWSGEDDPAAPAGLAARWDRFSTAGVSHRLFKGGHFFLRHDPAFPAALHAALEAIAARGQVAA